MLHTKVGPFLILNQLGSNRRQKVYHARQVAQDREVALKFISIPDEVEFTTALSKIEIEVKELQKLRHPNLVKVYGAGVHEERVFFARELVEGESLAAMLSRRGKLPPDLVLDYGKQIADLLIFLHQQDLIHTSLTPEKILITDDHQVKVTGLRLNRPHRRRWDTGRHRDLDSAAYLAPEQMTEGATLKSDLYSLGVILFEMLAGQLPYAPESIGRMTQSKLNAPVPSVAAHLMNCPVHLDKLITQMLQPSPRKRPHSARAVALTLAEIKKLDTTKKAAVDQVTGSFNPLNAGTDKTEARKLLGQKPKRNSESASDFFQSVPFMVGSLILILGLVVFLALPPSTSDRMHEARELLKSENASHWNEARLILRPIMEGNSNFAAQAEQMYVESRRKSLVRQAERGVNHRLQSENVRRFGKAVRLQQDGRVEESNLIFRELVASIDPDGDEAYIRDEAQLRIQEIQQAPPLPTDPQILMQIIRQSSLATNPPELVAAHDTLSKIMLQFAGEEGYQEVIEATMNVLPMIKHKLSQMTEQGPANTNSSDANEVNPETAPSNQPKQSRE